MANEEGSPPVLHQIIARTLEALSQQSAFDEDTLNRLRELAKSGDLDKFDRVVSALNTGKEK